MMWSNSASFKRGPIILVLKSVVPFSLFLLPPSPNCKQGLGILANTWLLLEMHTIHHTLILISGLTMITNSLTDKELDEKLIFCSSYFSFAASITLYEEAVQRRIFYFSTLVKKANLFVVLGEQKCTPQIWSARTDRPPCWTRVGR